MLCGMYGSRVEIRLVMRKYCLARLLRWLRTAVILGDLKILYFKYTSNTKLTRCATDFITKPDRNQNKNEIESLQTRNVITKICTHDTCFQINNNNNNNNNNDNNNNNNNNNIHYLYSLFVKFWF